MRPCASLAKPRACHASASRGDAFTAFSARCLRLYCRLETKVIFRRAMGECKTKPGHGADILRLFFQGLTKQSQSVFIVVKRPTRQIDASLIEKVTGPRWPTHPPQHLGGTLADCGVKNLVDMDVRIKKHSHMPSPGEPFSFFCGNQEISWRDGFSALAANRYPMPRSVAI